MSPRGCRAVLRRAILELVAAMLSLRRRPAVLAAALLVVSLPACGHYSFTGATIPEHIQTVAIPLTEDLSANPLTDLGGELTRLLVDRFVGQTRLQLETDESQSDALLTTAIQSYSVQPAAVGGENQATLNRLSISVRATYADREQDQPQFDRTFSGSLEYDPVSLANEEEAAHEILGDIADDIFTAATSNW